MVSLVNLVGITFQDCKQCENLPPLGKLPFLKVLELKGLDALRRFDDNECYIKDSFPCLGKLIISDCPCLTELPHLPKLKSLQLNRSNENIVRSVGKLTTLTFFEIEGLKEMKSLPDDMLSNQTSLEELSIKRCDGLESFPELKEHNRLNCLKKLRVESCHRLTYIPSNWFQGTPNLRSLDVLNCSKIESLPQGLQHATALEELRIMGCPNLQVLPDGLQKLKALKSLIIEDCKHVKISCEKVIGGD